MDPYAEKMAQFQRLAGAVKISGSAYDVGTTEGIKVTESPIIAMGRAIDTMNALVSRVASLTERLVGPEPKNADQSAQPPQVPYIFPALDRAAGDLQRSAQFALYQLERIERALP